MSREQSASMLPRSQKREVILDDHPEEEVASSGLSRAGEAMEDMSNLRLK